MFDVFIVDFEQVIDQSVKQLKKLYKISQTISGTILASYSITLNH